VEKDLLPEVGKESMGVIANALLFSNKGSLGILFGESVWIYIGGKMVDTFLGMLSSGHGARV
jgi:hypothetical protein